MGKLDIFKHHSSRQTQPIMTDTTMLSEEERALLEKAHNKEWGLPKFKARWFVGEASLTPFAKLRQYMLELKSREGAIEAIEYEIAKFEVEQEMYERDAANETDELKKKLLNIEALKVQKDANRSRVRVADYYKERNQFITLIEELLESDEGKLPDGRSLLDAIDTPQEEELEYHYWTVRLARQAALDMSAYGRIGAGNLEAILMCAPEQQTEIIALANHLNLTYDKRQDLIRQEMAQRLGMDTGKQLYIGQLDPDLINAAIDADRAEIEQELQNKMQQPQQGNLSGPTTNEAAELNNVYNL